MTVVADFARKTELPVPVGWQSVGMWLLAEFVHKRAVRLVAPLDSVRAEVDHKTPLVALQGSARVEVGHKMLAVA
jgi:hypothetical protein